MYQVTREIDVPVQESFKVYASYSMEIENVGKGTIQLHQEGDLVMTMPPGALFLMSGRGVEIMFQATSDPYGWGTKLRVTASCLTYQPRITEMSDVPKAAAVEKKCRCGAHSVKSTKHYEWCELYNKESV